MQAAAAAALLDQEYFKACTKTILETRAKTIAALESLEFEVKPSETNFLFCIPPMNAQLYTQKVKEVYLNPNVSEEWLLDCFDECIKNDQTITKVMLKKSTITDN